MEMSINVLVVAVWCAVALVVAGLVGWAFYETRENRETVCAILGVDCAAAGRGVRISYGRLRVPFTLGRPRVVRIRVADKLIAGIENREQANDRGLRICSSLGMSECDALTGRRCHLWVLT